MRVARLVLSFVPIFGFSPRLNSQQSVVTTQRDPQALVLLTKSLNVTGGVAYIAAIHDFTATGTITYNWAGEAVPGSLTVYGKGLNEFRMDANVSSGTQSFILNGAEGALFPLNGPKTKLPFYSVMTAGSLTFPAARIANVLSDSTISVSYLGMHTWNGSQVCLVHVAPLLDPTFNLAAPLSGLGEFDLYIDPTSYQPLGLSDKIWSNTDMTQPYLHEIVFSNYTATNGLSIPFTITERVSGQQTWSITLTSARFNSGLPDSLFEF